MLENVVKSELSGNHKKLVVSYRIIRNRLILVKIVYCELRMWGHNAYQGCVVQWNVWKSWGISGNFTLAWCLEVVTL